MKAKRIIGTVSILLAGSFALTACDPPMPPEVAAALAEQTYTCLEGDSQVAAPAAMQDLLWGWTDSLSYACVDPEPVMTMTAATDPTKSDVEISEYAPTCVNAYSTPLAVDAAVLIYMESEVSALSVSPKSLAGILTGKITNWNQLASDNPGYDMPNKALTVYKDADSVALQSMKDYLKLTGNEVKSTLFNAVDSPAMDSYGLLEEGQVAIVPNSYAVALGLYPASIYLGLDADQYPILANPDVAGIQSASTQWLVKTDAKSVTVRLDANKKPIAPEGSDVAPEPYQAIYPVNVTVCDPSRMISRAAARFLLRLDSQGALGASNYTPLPEAVRITSLLEISKGLPTPTPTPTE